MKINSQKAKGKKQKSEQTEGPLQFPLFSLQPLASSLQLASSFRIPHSALRICLVVFALLCLLLTPMNASAQVTGGGAMISLYGVVQVEPGPDVVTLEVKGEMIRFAIQNVYCSDRRFSTGGFMTDVTRKEPGLHLRGAEEWLEMLIKEPPSKRTLQMTGAYYRDSRMFVLNKLARFSGKPGLQQ